MGTIWNFRFYLYCIIIYFISLAEFSAQKSIPIEKSTECNPSGDPQQDQYVVGYGSLVKSASKNRTFQNTGANIPVLISGYARIWNCKGVSSSLSTTYLGITPISNATLNGVVFKIPNSIALDAYDERELYYCREEVKKELISLLVSSDQNPARLPSGQYWIYVTKPQYTAFPSREYPIVQSYVDTFLSGCLEIQKNHNLDNFAEDCIKTTEGWGFSWVNDRIYPRRPFIHEPMAGKIDKLISKVLPEQFKSITIE